MSFMAYSQQPTVAVDISCSSGDEPFDQEKAGGRYAADLLVQLPARGASSVALHALSQPSDARFERPATAEGGASSSASTELRDSRRRHVARPRSMGR
jgi:hypothetical protein